MASNFNAKDCLMRNTNYSISTVYVISIIFIAQLFHVARLHMTRINIMPDAKVIFRPNEFRFV